LSHLERAHSVATCDTICQQQQQQQACATLQQLRGGVRVKFGECCIVLFPAGRFLTIFIAAAAAAVFVGWS
jgi:hypothetical protein